MTAAVVHNTLDTAFLAYNLRYYIGICYLKIQRFRPTTGILPTAKRNVHSFMNMSCRHSGIMVSLCTCAQMVIALSNTIPLSLEGADQKDVVFLSESNNVYRTVRVTPPNAACYAVIYSRAQQAGLLNSDHPVSISVIHVEQHLYQLDIFFLEEVEIVGFFCVPSAYKKVSSSRSRNAIQNKHHGTRRDSINT